MKKIIKNYFMAIVAVMMIAGFSAFKLAETGTEKASMKGCAANFEEQGLIPFFYNSNDYSKDAVEDLDNWIHNPTREPDDDCDQDDEIPCALLIDPEYVYENNNEELKLDASLNLSAASQGNPLDPTYVQSITTGAGQIFNKSM